MCTDPKVGFTQALLSYLVGYAAQPRRRRSQELLYSLHSKRESRTPLVIQWLRLCASNIGATGSIPVWEGFACHAVQSKKS